MTAVICNHHNFMCYDRSPFSLCKRTNEDFKGSQELFLPLSYCLAVHRALPSINSIFWCKLQTVLLYLDLTQPAYFGIVIQKQERTIIIIKQNTSYCQRVGSVEYPTLIKFLEG